MEDHGGDHHHPPAAATLAYAWDHYQPDEHAGDQQQLVDCFAFSSSPSELRRALVRSLAELDAARAAHQAELRRVESEAARLAALVASAAAERDELRRHCHSLLLLLHHHQSQEAPPPTLIRAGDDHVQVVQARGIMDDDSTETELETALERRLPEKGRLVEAVVSAGPLLQTLLLAGPLPRWRHPPPPAPADIPPFNPGRLSSSPIKTDSFSSASAGSSSPESNCSGGAPPTLPQQQPLPPFHMGPFCM